MCVQVENKSKFLQSGIKVLDQIEKCKQATMNKEIKQTNQLIN